MVVFKTRLRRNHGRSACERRRTFTFFWAGGEFDALSGLCRAIDKHSSLSLRRKAPKARTFFYSVGPDRRSVHG
jgi:hypothetical protein